MAQNFYKQNGSYFLEGSNQKIADVASLQNYAKLGGKEVAYKSPVVTPQIPTGAVAINGAQYNTGDLQKANFTNIQPINGGLYGIPKVPSQLNSNSLTSPSATVQTVTPNPLSPEALMAGVKTSNEGVLAQLKARDAQLAEQTNLTELQKRQADFAESNKTSLRDTQQATWNQYGLDANVAQVQQLMPQIQKTTAEFNALQEQNANLPIASRIIGGTQDRLTRQKAIEVAGLSAVAQAYQGNVDMARNIATDAINAQYKDQETYYNSLNDQISNAYTDLTAAEKKRADKLMIVNEERLRNIEVEKEFKKQINEAAISAAKNGADPSTVSRILNSKTPEEAIINSKGFYTAPSSSTKKFISATATQPAGYFDETTGIFTPLSSTSIPTDQGKLDKANNIISIADEIAGLDLSGVTGLIGGRITLTPNQILADSKIKQLTGLLTLDNMGIMKGVLSDSDIKIIKEASTSLKRTLSETDFRNELTKIKNTSDRVVAGNEILTADPSKVDELRRIMNEVPDITGDELRQIYFNNTGSESLGDLSKKYESGGDSKAIGYDSTGGDSYGTYQLTKGNVGKFLNTLGQMPMFKDITNSIKAAKIGSSLFNNLWKKAVDTDPQAFKQAEEKYISSTHYEPQIKKLESSGVPINNYSDVLKQVIWSTAVQHGPATNLIATAYNTLKGILNREPNEKELIAKIYDNRWSNGANFKSSTPAVRKSVFNRFQDELKTALSKISNKA